MMITKGMEPSVDIFYTYEDSTHEMCCIVRPLNGSRYQPQDSARAREEKELRRQALASAQEGGSGHHRCIGRRETGASSDLP